MSRPRPARLIIIPPWGRAWRWLGLALLPFLLLGLATLSANSGPAPAPHVLRDVLHDSPMIGMDKLGRTYFWNSETGITALDPEGKLLWTLGTSELFDDEMFAAGFRPAIRRLQAQVDAGVIFETDDGPLCCVDPGGFVRWRFDPRDIFAANGNGNAALQVKLYMDPQQVPPFTCWHDRQDTLYALDESGNLLWTTEAWVDASRFPDQRIGGHFGGYYGEHGDWADGSILVTVLRPQTMADKGTGDYILRRVLRNGSTQDLWRIDLHGQQAPPVEIGDNVLSWDVGGRSGLCRFRDGRQYAGYPVLLAAHWCPLTDGWLVYWGNNAIDCYETDGNLRWQRIETDVVGLLAARRGARIYYAAVGQPQYGLLANWPMALAIAKRLRVRRALGGKQGSARLCCLNGQGDLLWQSEFSCTNGTGTLHQAGDWLALEDGLDLLLFHLPPAP